MNRLYKSFFSKQLGRFVVASENARTKTKSSKTTTAAAVVAAIGITFSSGAIAALDSYVISSDGEVSSTSRLNNIQNQAHIIADIPVHISWNADIGMFANNGDATEILKLEDAARLAQANFKYAEFEDDSQRDYFKRYLTNITDFANAYYRNGEVVTQEAMNRYDNELYAMRITYPGGITDQNGNEINGYEQIAGIFKDLINVINGNLQTPDMSGWSDEEIASYTRYVQKQNEIAVGLTDGSYNTVQGMNLATIGNANTNIGNRNHVQGNGISVIGGNNFVTGFGLSTDSYLSGNELDAQLSVVGYGNDLEGFAQGSVTGNNNGLYEGSGAVVGNSNLIQGSGGANLLGDYNEITNSSAITITGNNNYSNDEWNVGYFGDSNGGYENENTGIFGSGNNAYSTSYSNVIGRLNNSEYDYKVTVTGLVNNSYSNYNSYIAGNFNEVNNIYGATVVGRNNSIQQNYSESSDYWFAGPGYWEGESPYNYSYTTGETNVFGGDNIISSSNTTVVGNYNMGQNASPRYEAMKLASFGPEIIDSDHEWRSQELIADYFGWQNSDNSVVSGNDNIFGGNTSIHGLANKIYGDSHNITGAHNITYGENNNIHGSGNMVGEVRYDNVWGEYLDWNTEWTEGDIWTPVDISQSYNNNVVGSHNAVVGDDNSVLGNNNRSQYTTDPGKPFVNAPELATMMASPVGENITDAISNGAFGYEQFSDTTYASAVVGVDNIFGAYSNVVGIENESYGWNNSSVGNRNSLAGSSNNVLGSDNFTGGVYSEEFWVYDPETGYYNSEYQDSIYTSSDVTAVGNNNKAIGLGHAVIGNSNTLIGTPGWQDDFYGSGNNRFVWDYMEDGMRPGEWLNSPYFYGFEGGDVAGGYYSNVLGSYNNIGTTYSTTLGNSNHVEGHSVNTLGNLNEVYGTNNSVVGNGNMMAAERTNVLGNNNWNAVVLFDGYDEGGYPELNEKFSEQYAQGTWNEWLNESYAPYDKMNQAIDLITSSPYFSSDFEDGNLVTNSDIVGSHNIVLGDRLLVAGQGNIVEGNRQTVIGHDNIAAGEHAVALGTDNTAISDMLGELSEEEIALALEEAPQAAPYLENSYNYSPVAIGSRNSTMNGGIALGTDNTAGFEGIAIGHNNMAGFGNIALGSGVLSMGETLNNEAFYVGGTASSQLAIGNNGENMRITGVAAGSNPNDAVNVEQLTAVVNDMDPKGNVKYKEILDAEGNSVLDEKGLKTYDFSVVELATKATVETEAKYNVSVVEDGTGTVIENVGNATEADHAVNKGQLDYAIAGVQDGLNGAVKYERDAAGNINFEKAILEGTQTVIAADAKYTDVQVVKSGGTVIDNVANATEADHAVNKGQLDLEIAGVKDGLDGAVKYERDAEGNINFEKAILEGTQTVIAADAKYTDVQVVKSGGTVIDNVANATEADHAVNKGQLDLEIAGVKDGLDGAVKYERDADGNINFDKAVLEGTQTVIAADTKYTDVQVVTSGGTVIDNVANATEADHAVNKGQMDVAIAGVQDGLDGTVKYGRDGEGNIDFTNVMLATETVKGTDANGTDYVVSGGSTINNVATATEYHQAINKGQFDQGLDALRDGAVMYALNGDGTVNKGLVNLAGVETTISSNKYNVAVVTSGGTVLNNVANATEADHAVNKGQLDFAIAGVSDGINGAVKYERDADGNINFDKAVLEGTQTVIAADAKYTDVQVVTSGGTVIDNVANATEADHAVNKGQMDVAIAGVQDGLDGAVKYGRDGEGKIDFSNVNLAIETVKGTDGNGTDYVVSGGSTINNVATATEYHQAINKGQFDQGLDALRDGAVMYALNGDGTVNKGLVNLAGVETTISSSNKYNVAVVTSGGTVLNNVANATEADHAVNKGQMDFAIAGVADGINGAVKYERDADGNINFDKAVLEGTQTVIAADAKYKDVQVVTSGGTVIDNVANATEADHAVNKGQMDVAIAGVQDGLDGAVKYGRDGEGNIDFTNVVLATATEKGTDANGTDYVVSGGSTINNVATATEYHQAINKGQFDQGLDGIRNGAVMYALNLDGSVNKDIVNLMGTPIVAGESYGVQVAVSGGTVINNVAKATEFHQAINKGQLDEAIAQVYLENDGASVKYDIANGGIDYKNVTLKNDVVAGTDSYGIEVVASGGTNINNVATATEFHQAVNKGQMDSEFAKRDDLLAGAVQYDRNSDNSINFDKVTFAGEQAVTGVNDIGVEVVTSGGTVLANVGNATEAHHAINKGQFDDAIARLEAETEGTVKYDKNTDGTIDYSNITLAGETAVVEKNADGIDVVTSGGTSINNVATATEAHQAINKGQFDEALSKIEGEAAGNVKYDKNTDGSVDYNNVTYAGDKAVVEKNDIGIDVVTSGGTTLKNIATATQADEAINKGQFDDGLARLEDGTVQYARNEDGSVNKNSVVLGGDKTVIAKNEAGIEVVKSGGTVISNVAVATQADHAINKGQFDEGLHQVRDYADQGDINTLNNANSYTDNRVDSLWDAFQDESKDLRAGIAGAMAVGNLPQPSEAGYSMFSMGVATYKGQQAIAMGLSAITEDKRYIFKIAATTTSRNDTGGAASVGLQWK